MGDRAPQIWPKASCARIRPPPRARANFSYTSDQTSVVLVNTKRINLLRRAWSQLVGEMLDEEDSFFLCERGTTEV